jgi:hypothetical protein
MGVQTDAPISGLRGTRVTWVDADGTPGSKVFDIAAYTCAPRACDHLPSDAGDVDDAVLRELGLLE